MPIKIKYVDNGIGVLCIGERIVLAMTLLDAMKKSTPVIYEIKIKGHLDEQWADWFEGMTFTHQSDGTTTLHGFVIDQAALHGILNGIRDLGLALISVQRVDPDRTND